MTYRTLILAGWLAMISAFVSIPLSYVLYRLEGNTDITVTAAKIGIQAGGIVLYVAISLFLKRLLNAGFGFRDADKSIILMIVANVVASMLAVASLCYAPLKETLDMAALAPMIFQGFIQIQFGYKLLKLPHNLDGMLRPFCYLNMATGVCVASVVLLIAGIVVSSISDLMLGTIFFHIARLVRRPDSGGK